MECSMNLPATVGVTGAAGFVGANLVERLLDEGCRVVGIDDFSMSGPENLRGILGRPGFELHEYDCRDTARLRRDFADVGGIMHLAACKIPRFGGALNTMHVNVDGSQAAFNVALALDVPIVFTSTSDVYGNAATPFREDGEIVLGPPTSRRWSYAASKYFDEHLALRMHEEEGLKVSILRLFNAYGARNHPSWWGGPLAVFLEDLLDGKEMEIHGDGLQVRSFTYVSDTVDGFVRALATPEAIGEVINIANEEPIRIIDLAQEVQTAMGFDGPLRAKVVSYESMGGNYQDVKIRIPSVEKAERILGFKAQVKLDAGLESTIAWHRSLREERVPA
jgi:nucleoside-diphosphate-sugar epimerase